MQAAEKRARHDEYVAGKQQQHKHATDFADAITAYLRNSCDPTPLKAWFAANKPFAEYEMSTCGLYFSEDFQCLPDSTKYPIFIAVYMNVVRIVNHASNLQMIDRPPLPTLKSICEQAARPVGLQLEFH